MSKQLPRIFGGAFRLCQTTRQRKQYVQQELEFYNLDVMMGVIRLQ